MIFFFFFFFPQKDLISKNPQDLFTVIPVIKARKEVQTECSVFKTTDSVHLCVEEILTKLYLPIFVPKIQILGCSPAWVLLAPTHRR